MSTKCPNPACGAIIEKGMLYCSECSASTPEMQREAIEDAYSGRPEHILNNIRLEIGCNSLAIGTHGMLPLRFINVCNQQPIVSIKLSLQCSACDDDKEIRVDRQVEVSVGETININDCEFNINCSEGAYNLKIQGELLIGETTPVAFQASERILIKKTQQTGSRKIKIHATDGGVVDADSLPSDSEIDIRVGGGGVVGLGGIIGGQSPSGREVEWVALNLEFAPDKTRLLESFLESQEEVSTENIPEKQSLLNSTALWCVHRPEGADRLVRIYTGNHFILGRDPQQVDLVTTFLPATEENIKNSRAISGKQCTLSLTKNMVFVADCDSKNGVRVQGRMITEKCELTNGCRLLLANIFRFDFFEFRELFAIKEITEIRNNARDFNDFSTRIGGLKIDDLRHDVQLDCVVLARCDDFSDRLRYLFLRRFVETGSSSASGLFLGRSSVGKKHARLMLMENGYFLEALDSRRETWIGDSRLYPGPPRPLPPGGEVQLRFGEIVVTFQAMIEE